MTHGNQADVVVIDDPLLQQVELITYYIRSSCVYCKHYLTFELDLCEKRRDLYLGDRYQQTKIETL